MRVEFYRHNITGEDIDNVVKVLNSIFLTNGPVTTKFEEKFSGYTGLAHTVAVSSGTAALHLAMLALGIGPGDEVITTPMTFIATATSILHAGAEPVFVDVEHDTGLLDVSKVEASITARTKAIVPVHLYGTMVDMVKLRDIADRYGLKVIEDCAHCLEGMRDGIRPGQLGDAACYSFYATKNLTCGEGGAVATNNEDVAKKIRVLRLHGMSKDAASRYSGYYEHWDMLALGWKYNMDDIHAALLIKQLDRIDEYWQRRESISRTYDEAFSSLPEIKVPYVKGKSARHLYTIWVKPEVRDEVLRKLQDRGVGVAVNYRAIHNLTYFRESFGFVPGDFPIADTIGRSTISLPLYPKLRDIEIDYVIESVQASI